MAILTLSPVPYAASVTLPAPYPEKTTFPLALSPSTPSASLEDKLAAIRDLVSTGQLPKVLSRHGAIYFKDLGLSDAHEFSKFAHAFGWLPHEDIGNPVRRTILAKNVATANEGPNTQPVYPHNEFGLSPHYPAYVFFYCVSAPETGGETPINNSIVLYEQLKERHPEFIEELEKKVAALPYSLFISPTLISPTGRQVHTLLPQRPANPDRVGGDNSASGLRPACSRYRLHGSRPGQDREGDPSSSHCGLGVGEYFRDQPPWRSADMATPSGC